MRDDLPVALKLLRAAAAHESVASDRLRREAEALGLAWHPNVVEVIDHGHLPDGTAYLVLELLFGESLNARLRTKKKLTEQELLPIALQVCDALAAVHAAGVIHRDIKPGNIFLERIDIAGKLGGERVKVVDFGIARVEWEETRITNIGSPVGTPGYMSPEQEAGMAVDARSDLFALGASLYECLVGDTPPPTPSGMWLVASSESAPATGPRASQIKSALREASPEWRTLIERALMPNPDDRFQDARAFGQALRGLRRETTTPESATS
jgi:eukaryotic-like serine/threonine-protein kinase